MPDSSTRRARARVRFHLPVDLLLHRVGMPDVVETRLPVSPADSISRSPAPMMRSQIPWWKLMLLMRSIGISTPCLASTPVRKITRSVVTTKCVNFQFKYFAREPAAPTRARSAQSTTQVIPLFSFHTSSSSRKSGIAGEMCLAKYHQCGRRSSASSSPALSSFLGYGTRAMLGPHLPVTGGRRP